MMWPWQKAETNQPETVRITIRGTVVSVLQALPALIKLIVELMGLAEKAMGSGTGPDKKASVLGTIEAIVDNQTVWTDIQGLLSGVVNMLAALKFGSK